MHVDIYTYILCRLEIIIMLEHMIKFCGLNNQNCMNCIANHYFIFALEKIGQSA